MKNTLINSAYIFCLSFCFFVILKFFQPQKNMTQLSLLSLVLVVLIGFLFLKRIQLEIQRDHAKDKLIQKNRVGGQTMVNLFANMLLEGYSNKQVKFLFNQSEIKIAPNIFKYIKMRAELLVDPIFNHQQSNNIKERFLVQLLILLVILLVIGISYGIVYADIFCLLICVFCLLGIYSFLVPFWRLAGEPKGDSALLSTAQYLLKKYHQKHFKIVLLIYVLNFAYLRITKSNLSDAPRIYTSNQYNHLKHDGYFETGCLTIYELCSNQIIQHHYSDDPRERYWYKVYTSIDDFIERYLHSLVRNYYQVAMTDFTKISYQQESIIAKHENRQPMPYLTLMHQIEVKFDDYFASELRKVMRCFRYKTFTRLILNGCT